MMLLTVLAAVMTYGGTVSHRLGWDDNILLESIRGIVASKGAAGLLLAGFIPPGAGGSGYFRPVVLLSLWADLRLSGFLPHAFHLTNILLHALNSVLVFLLLARVLGRRDAALPGALVFAVHPVHVEAVAFVSGRTDLLAAFFCLLSALLWMDDAPRDRPWRWASRGGSLLAFILAALSKEVALVLPAALLACALIAGRGREAPGGRRWPGIPAWLGLWTAALIAVALLRRAAGVGWGAGDSGLFPHLRLSAEAAAFALRAAFAYLKLLLAPWPLNAFYTPDQVRLDLATAVPALLFLAWCFALRGGRFARAGLLALAWTTIFLIPVLGLVPLSGAGIAERYLYLPSFGVSLLVGALAGRVPLRTLPGKAVVAVLAGLVVSMGAASYSRARVWKDDLTLFSDLTRTSPRSGLAFFCLGRTHAALGHPQEAAAAYRRAVEIDPADAEAWSGLGRAYEALGRTEDALDAYRQGGARRQHDLR